MTESRAKICHYKDIPSEIFGEEAPGVTIRWVIDQKSDGAPVYALRIIEVQAGGHTPDHSHPYEHENYVIEGEGRVKIDSQWSNVGPGTVIFVPSGVQHTYINTGDRPFISVSYTHLTLPTN